MTLFRQLIIIISILFLIVFSGIFFVSVENTRAFLSSQLQSHAQDAATSLGLSLSPHAAEHDITTMTLMVDAMFDSGYYREISMIDISGKPVIERTLPVHIEGVPQWFVNLVPLETPQGEALVMAGWQRAGVIQVRSNPGIAYAKLWHDTEGIFWMLLGAAAISLGLGWLLLKFSLRPLHALEQQADAICKREYPVQSEIPWTRELRAFVLAMNRMVVKVKEMFEQQAQAMERLQTQVYMDPVTHLGNRRHLEVRLQSMLKDPEQFASGALFLLELNEFKRYNDRHGYEAADELLKHVAKLLNAIGSIYADSVIVRLGGAVFALVIPNVDTSTVENLGAEMSTLLRNLLVAGLFDEQDAGNVGIALLRGQESVSALMSEADLALRTAQKQGSNAWHLGNPEQYEQSEISGAVEWSGFLREVIGKRRISLFLQPVLDQARGRIIHNEVLLRIQGSQDRLLSAGIFMPFVHRFGLDAELDRVVVTEAMSRMRATVTDIAINLTQESVQDPAFTDWLVTELTSHPQLAARLIFELTEYGTLNNLAAVENLITRASATGARFSLDHFGRGLSPFGYLSHLKVHYLKIDGSFIRNIDQDRDNQFFVDAVAKIAQGLDIEVIAESVETEAEKEMLRTLKIHGLQGYLVGKPEPWQV